MKRLKIVFSLVLVLSYFMAEAAPLPIKTIEMKKETQDYFFDIQYPKTTSVEINKVIKAYVAYAKKNILAPVLKRGAGKNGLKLTYESKYNTGKVLSLVFTASYFTQGAAHPNSVVKTLNFIGNREVSLQDLFNPHTAYLKNIAHFSKVVLLKKKVSNAQWINEGTKPTLKNYDLWYFNPEGLVIIFDTYQVAPYVFGPQEVLLPKNFIKPWLQKEPGSQVWFF